MTDKERCLLALSVVAGTTRRLELPDITALGINQPTEAPCDSLYFGDGDFCWRGEVANGPMKGAPLKVDPQKVREGAVKLLVDMFEKLGAFKRVKKSTPSANPKTGISPQLLPKGSRALRGTQGRK